MLNLKDTVTIITGAVGNLGRACATQIAQAGGSLALLDISQDRLVAAYPDHPDCSRRQLLAAIELTDSDAVAEAMAVIDKQFGRIDAVVHTVGAYRGAEIKNDTWNTWDFLFSVNVRTAFVTVQAALPYMTARQKGSIVTVASRNAFEGAAGFAAYSAAKAALMRMTESLAAELKPDHVRANIVIPGTMDTAGNRQAMPNADLSSWVTPESVASVIAFLLSDAACDVTGAWLPVYGRS